MSDVGGSLLSVGAGAIGFVAGGPIGAFAGFAAGGFAAQALLPQPALPERITEGPRLADLKIQSAAYGKPIPVVYGRMRTAGNIIWKQPLIEEQQVNESGSTGSGNHVAVVNYNYYATFAVAICKGPIAGVIKIWADSKLIYNADTSDADTLSANDLVPVTVFHGDETQTASSLIESFEGAGNVPAYRGLAYVLFERLPLRNYGNRIPNLTFEVAVGTNNSGIADSDYKLIAHFNGADQSTAFTDSSVYHKALTGSGAKLSTAQSVFGPASCLFSTVNDYIQAPAGADWNLPHNSAWQVSFRLRITSAPTTWHSVLATSDWGFDYGNSNKIGLFFNGGAISFQFTQALSLNTWYAWRISNDGAGHVRLYINGSQVGSTQTLTANSTTGEALRIGKITGATGFMGHIDELIFQRGGAVTTDTSYTVETSETNVAGAPGSDVSDQNIKDIVADLVQSCGLTAGDYDVSTINEQTVWTNAELLVKGFIVNGSGISVRKAIEDLAGAFLFEVYESDGKLHFNHRNNIINGGPVATIPESELGAHPLGTGESDLLEIVARQEVELPRDLTVRYLNPQRSYWQGIQRAQLQQANSVLKQDHDFPIAMTDDQAKVSALAGLMLPWAERRSFRLALSAKYAWLEVGDIIAVEYNSRSFPMRIIKTNFDGGMLEVAAVSQDFAIDGAGGTVNRSTSGGGSAGPSVVSTISYPVATTIGILDVNLLSDADDGPGYYVSADKGASANYWPGAGIYKSSDDSAFVSILSVGAPAETGTATNVLADGPVTTWDRANSVNISMTNGQLYSDTEANVLNGANIGILGKEIFQWTTAVLESDGTYTLSGLLRGRRGTEWATGAHQIGDRFYLYQPVKLRRVFGLRDEIGLVRYYKAVTSGRPIAGEPSIQFVNTAAGLKPYAPGHIKGARDGSGNIALTWIRRTRVGGGWRDYVDASLGENIEQYSIDIMDGASVKRTFDGIAVPSAVYTAEQQTADFGAPQASAVVKIYQISADVGRGYAGVATV
ncbi:MAG: hypothetical protein HY579_08875 [Nitrospinae bacterium]|nr:hypothetical protein [Nitrospinota bacterium]